MENQIVLERRFLGLEGTEWRRWALWVLATTVPGFLGVVGLVIGSRGTLPFLALAVLFGVLVGAVQSLLLRGRLDRPGKWVWATALGWIACAVVNSVAGRIVARLPVFQSGLGPGFVVANIAIAALWGAAIGTAQWRFLRERVHRAGRWVWATALSWGAGWGLGWGGYSSIVSMMQLSGDFVVFPTSMAVAVGIMVGTITGFVLIVLLRHPTSAAPEPSQQANTR